MGAPTATTATAIRDYREANAFVQLAIAEGDFAAESAGMNDRRAASRTLTESGQGWVVKLLRDERYWTTVTNDENGAFASDDECARDRECLAFATVAVDKALTRLS